MRPIRFGIFLLLMAGALLGACEDRKAAESREERPQVVKVAPVETRPFEEGYAAGFSTGKAAGQPRAALPETSEVEAKASEAAGLDPQRAAKWQRGWVSGYMDGFRHSSAGSK